MDISEIYEDLPGTDLSEEIDKLKNENNLLHEHTKSLESDIEKLCSRITEMKRVQTNLTKNISELFKTAKAEVDRKDRMINELRSKLEESENQRNSLSVALKRKQEFANTNKHGSYQQQPHQNNKTWVRNAINNKSERFSPRDQSSIQPLPRNKEFQQKNMTYRGRDRFHPTKRHETRESHENERYRNSVRSEENRSLPNANIEVKLLKNPPDKYKLDLSNSSSNKKQTTNVELGNKSDETKKNVNNIAVRTEDLVKFETKSIKKHDNNENIGTKNTESTKTLKSDDEEQGNSCKRQKNLEDVAQALLKLQEIDCNQKTTSGGYLTCNQENNLAGVSNKGDVQQKTSEISKNSLRTQKSMKTDEKNRQENIKNQKKSIDFKNFSIIEHSSTTLQDTHKIDDAPEVQTLIKKETKGVTVEKELSFSKNNISSLKKEVLPPKAEVASLKTNVSPKTEIVSPKTEVVSPKTEVVSPKTEIVSPKTEIVSSRLSNQRNDNDANRLTALKQEIGKEEIIRNVTKEISSSETPLKVTSSRNLIIDNLIKVSSCENSRNLSPLKKRRKVIFSMID